MSALNKLREALLHAEPAQLAIALEVVAFMQIEAYIEHNPVPAGTTAAELALLKDAGTVNVIAQALNTAAEVLTGVKPADIVAQHNAAAVDNAADIASAAIAKAAGKLQ